MKGMNEMNKIELLAPAGSMDSLKAAIQNGADAVYIGGNKFGARAYANNFEEEELKEVINYAHIRNVKIYLTLNTLIKDSEIEEFIEYVGFLYRENVDALIVQDLGAIKIIKERFPNFELHASTQMTAHSIEDVRFLKNIGFSRVVVSRELTLKEIKEIKSQVDIELEVFVHGALCVSYSGQCLMSSLIGGRSGNRGRCAQPCRKEYELIDFETEEKINTDGRYILSTKDLNTIESINEIIKSGVESLKIEGRMKKPEYVSIVVKSYKDAIDGLYNRDIKKDIETIFNRGFTKGYVLDEQPNDIININNSGNKGTYLGDVIEFNVKSGKLKLKLVEKLNKYDGLDIGVSVGRVIKNGLILDHGNPGDIVEIDFIGKVNIGQKIFKTSDYDLIKRSNNWDVENFKIKLFGEAHLNKDKNAILKIWDSNGNEVVVESEKKCEEAIKVAITKEKVRDQLLKLGNTPYYFESLNVNVDENIVIPVSILNALRRNAIEELDKKRVKIIRKSVIKEDLNYKPNEDKKDEKNIIKFSVAISKFKQLEELLSLDETYLNSIDVIYYREKKSIKEAVNACSKFNIKILYYPSRIIKNNEYKELDDLVSNTNGVLITNLGLLNHRNETSDEKRLDWSLNIFNNESVKFLEACNIRSFCVSPELNLVEVESLLKDCKVRTVEAIVYGRQEVMISEYCPIGVLKRNCTRTLSCGNSNNFKYALRDEKNKNFPIGNDGSCRSIIYNSKILFGMEYMKDLSEFGVNLFRLDFTNEKNIHIIFKSFVNVKMNNYLITKDAQMVYLKLREKGITKGHYERGIE